MTELKLIEFLTESFCLISMSKKQSGASLKMFLLICLFGSSPPSALNRIAIVISLESLFLLGALTEESKLADPVGHQMARLPLEPMYSKALILANQFNCLEEMLIIVAMLSVESIFYAPRDKLEEVCMPL